MHNSVSIIIPCYAQAHFLPQAIESALRQTHPAEIVVVDDGSPDATAEIAGSYAQIRCIGQENQGLAEARNSGFRESRGDYVIFLDADDCLTASAVETHLDCFSRNPDAGFVVGDIDHIAEDGSAMESPRWPLLRENFYEELLRVNHVANTIAVMFRRGTVDAVGGFDRSCSPAEDYRLLLGAARLFPSAHHRDVVARYRRHPASLSRRGVVMLRAMDRVMKAEKEHVRDSAKLEGARREGVRYWRDHFGRVALKELFARARRGELAGVVGSWPQLLWYTRGEVLILPLRYWRRVWRIGRARLRNSSKA